MANSTEDFFETFKNRSVTNTKKFNFKKVEKKSSVTSVPEDSTCFSKSTEKKETSNLFSDSIDRELEAIFFEPSTKDITKSTKFDSNLSATSDKNLVPSTSSKPNFNFKRVLNGTNKNNSDTVINQGTKGLTNKSSSSTNSNLSSFFKTKTVQDSIASTSQTLQDKSVSTTTSTKLNFKFQRTSSSDDFEIKVPTQKTLSQKNSITKKDSDGSTQFKFKKKSKNNVPSTAIFESLFGETISTGSQKIGGNDNMEYVNNRTSSGEETQIVENEKLINSGSSSTGFSKIKSKYDLDCSSSSTDSPVVHQKKFVFRKPIISDSSSPRSPSLLSLKTTCNSNRDSIISISSTEASPIIQQKTSKIKPFDTPPLNNKLIDDEIKFISQSLATSEDDYMDDETFEKLFGGKTENTKDEKVDNIDLSTVHWGDDFSENGKAGSSCLKKESYTEEVSAINWEEDVFDEEAPISFKDRDDHSADFQKRYHFSDVMEEVLHQKFGLQTFRPQQREIINATLNRNDCFVLMPTGGGKSLCYQLPAVLSEGVSVVISPLRALIGDQVDKMNGLDIAAAHLCQDVGKDESNIIMTKLHCREPLIKLLYLTPEKIMASRIVSDMLKTLYQRGKLARIIIDEAHCLSQWGHDFRPDYKQLSYLKTEFKDCPIMCLTATATKQVENDVINILKLKNVKRFIMSFNRPNIKYQVIPKRGKFASDEIVTLIKKQFPRKSGIIYCLARNDCETLADILIGSGIMSRPYHAGMSDKIREAIQREWMQDRFFVIVATIAFGMGIDKPDVRFVIHNSIPKSVEAFYQESGRAGRDGDISYSYLFYNYSDVLRLQKIMQRERNATAKVREGHSNNLKQMVSFAENVVDCRRYLQLIHLGENFNRQVCIKNKATTCDNCLNINSYNNIDVTKEARELVTLVRDLSDRGNVTLLHVAEVYKGAKIKKIMEKGHDSHPLYAKGSHLDKTDIHRILKDLVLRNVLGDFVVCTGEFPIVYIKLGNKSSAINISNVKVTIPVNKKSVKRINSVVLDAKEKSVEDIIDSPGPSTSLPKITSSNRPKPSTYAKFNQTKIEKLKVECHEALLEECRRLALEKNQTLSAVMNLTAIKLMSDFLPNTKQEFLKIEHVTVANYTKCGENFLAITSKYREQVDKLTTAAKIPDRPMFGANYASENDWCSSSQSSPSRGTKRKGRGGTAATRTKRAKTTTRKRYTKKKSPKKWKPKKGSWSGSGRGGKGGKKSGGSGGLGLMPIHIK